MSDASEGGQSDPATVSPNGPIDFETLDLSP
jgi:hypothetical protein